MCLMSWVPHLEQITNNCCYMVFVTCEKGSPFPWGLVPKKIKAKATCDTCYLKNTHQQKKTYISPLNKGPKVGMWVSR